MKTMERDDLRDAFDIARFGIEVENFLLSGLGKYLVNRAEDERNRAINEFKNVEPSDIEAVRKLQLSINTPDQIIKWITEAIEGGRAAHDAIRDSEAEQGE